MLEYRVVEDNADLEEVNALAAEGWRVITVVERREQFGSTRYLMEHGGPAKPEHD